MTAHQCPACDGRRVLEDVRRLPAALGVAFRYRVTPRLCHVCRGVGVLWATCDQYDVAWRRDQEVAA